MSFEADKNVEKSRYNTTVSNKTTELLSTPLGSRRISECIRSPYVAFEDEIRSISNEIKIERVLDVCCGDGQYSFTLSNQALSVYGLDISEASLEVAKKRSEEVRTNSTFHWVKGDCESLPFEDNFFTVVTIAGSLSYGRLDKILPEILRVLSSNGHFICVDSLHHNPIYKVNRYIAYLRGKRSKSTLHNMPRMHSIRQITGCFDDAKVTYFGILSFTAPILSKVLPEKKISIFLDTTDKLLRSLKRFSFKFLIHGRNPIKSTSSKT